jgi:hypothetical protein
MPFSRSRTGLPTKQFEVKNPGNDEDAMSRVLLLGASGGMGQRIAALRKAHGPGISFDEAARSLRACGFEVFVELAFD